SCQVEKCCPHESRKSQISISNHVRGSQEAFGHPPWTGPGPWARGPGPSWSKHLREIRVTGAPTPTHTIPQRAEMICVGDQDVAIEPRADVVLERLERLRDAAREQQPLRIEPVDDDGEPCAERLAHLVHDLGGAGIAPGGELEHLRRGHLALQALTALPRDVG